MVNERRARRYAIVSGKGGVGKSVVAANLAAALSAAGQRVLVLDADLGLANLDVILGLNPVHTLLDVLKGQCKVEEALLAAPGGFDLLPAGSGLLEGTRLTESITTQLSPLLLGIDSLYDTILFDAGAGIGDVVLFFAQLADEVLLVLTPEPTSLMDGYATIKILASRFGRRDLLLVVNQADRARPDQAGAAVTKNLQQVATRFLMKDGLDPVRLQLAGSVPKDPAVPQAISRQQLLLHSHPEAPAAKAIRQLGQYLLQCSLAQG